MARSTVLADTSGILALLDRDEQHHAAAVEIVRTETILVPATVLPEVDYLSSKYLGEQVARAFLQDIIAGYFTHPVDPIDLKQALKVMARYKDVPLGLVDASLVAHVGLIKEHLDQYLILGVSLPSALPVVELTGLLPLG